MDISLECEIINLCPILGREFPGQNASEMVSQVYILHVLIKSAYLVSNHQLSHYVHCTYFWWPPATLGALLMLV